jgi:acyl-coenzyme A thioesterase PaaI-like protein
MPASPWFLPPAGVIPQGVLCVLCDAPLGSAIQTGLPAATAYTTSELSLNTLRPALPSSGTLIARGRLVMGGQSLALSESRRSRTTCTPTRRFAPWSAGRCPSRSGTS